MEDESQHIRYLVVIAALLCAVMIGYNAFYVPDTDLAALTAGADLSSVCSALPSNGEYVPRSTERSAASSSQPVQDLRSSGTQTAASHTGGTKVDLNTATAEQLETLDGIGETLAKRILSYRQEHGRFHSVDELKNVSGIGDKKFEAVRSSITVG